MKWFLLSALAFGCSAQPTPPSHVPARTIGATDHGLIADDTPLDLVVGLKLADHSDVGHAMSPEEFGAAFAPSVRDYARVHDWLVARGLPISRETPSRTTISVHAKASDIERAFHTEIHQYTDVHSDFFAPSREPVFDAEVANLIAGVVGFDNAAPFRSHFKQPTPYTPDSANSTQLPSDLQTLYNGTGVAQKGAGQTIVILGTGYAPDPVADVDAYVSLFYSGVINRQAQYAQVFLGGPNQDPDSFAEQEYGENVLDIDMAWAIAPLSNVVHVLTATNAPGLFSDGIVYAINNVPQAHAATVSYGLCERVSAGEVVVLDQLFAQARMQGQQWFFASGDDGTDDCQDGKGNPELSVEWPASSPYAFGVGGTELGAGGIEIAWSGGGGGESELFTKPAWQAGIGPYPNDGVREVPDFAALAGYPGVVTVSAGQSFASEGTSAATPMWAGVWVRLNEKIGGNGITTGAEKIYALAQSSPAVFNDIVTGMNGSSTTGYPAVVGFDLATGWGTPNIALLLNDWIP